MFLAAKSAGLERCQCFYHSSAGPKIILNVIPMILFLCDIIIVVCGLHFSHRIRMIIKT